jgi:osmotically-inducible protein OsmY
VKTDAQIKMDVLNALKWSSEIREEDLGVVVHNAAVTLTGHVPTYWQKQAAKTAAKRVADVKAVVDNVEVLLDSQVRMTDEGLAQRLANVLKWNVSIQGENVKAEVKNGVVTLTGEVEWQHQRANIERNIAHVSGVANVISLITIKPRLSAPHVKRQIREALEHHAEVEASKVSVEASDGKVTLSGTVDSLAEMDRIEDAVWAVPGVSKLVNNLYVASR